MSLFRAGLLDGLRVALTGPGDRALAEGLRALGAAIEPPEGAGRAAPHALIVDHAGEQPAGDTDGLRGWLDELWVPIERVVAGAMIPGGEPGKVVLVAPAPRAGSHAQAAGAAIVNLARTLSVEWARYRITVTAITPSDQTSAAELADLAAYLLSPGGDYFSGCRFELGAIRADRGGPGPARAR